MKKRVDQLKAYLSAFLTCIFNCGSTSVLNHSFLRSKYYFVAKDEALQNILEDSSCIFLLFL